MDRFSTTLTSKILTHRWWVIFSSGIIFLLCSLGLTQLTIDSDSRSFFSKDNPQLQQLEAVENIYIKNENILFVIAPKNRQVFTREVLQIISDMTEALWQTPASSRVDSITNFQHTWADGDNLIVEDLFENLASMSSGDIAQRRQVAMNEPILLNRLISRDAAVTNIVVNLNFIDKNPEIISEIAKFARKLRDEYRAAHPDIEFFLTGSVMFDTAFSEVGQKDMQTLVPLMLLVLVITIGLVFRTVVATLVTLLIIIMATGTAMGIAGWLGISINPASASAPTIILTLAVADSVHILYIMYHLISQGKNKEQAIIESIQFNFQAVFLTSLTTVVGFLTMNFSDAPPFHNLGNIVAIGITAAFFYSICFLPALISVLPFSNTIKNYRRQFKAMESIASRVIEHRLTILVITLAVAAVLTFSATQNRLNDNWINYFTTNVPVRVATDALEERISGADFIEYNIRSGRPQGINDPEFLVYLDRFVDWLRAHPQVEQVASLADVMKNLNRVMHGDDSSYYRLPERQDLAAQYLLLYEMSLPYGLDLNNQIDIEKRATRVAVTMKTISSVEVLAVEKRVHQWMQANTPEISTLGSSPTVMFAHIGMNNINSMITGTTVALVVISMILIFALRSLRYGVLSLIPNLAPAGMAFGLWALIDGEIGLALSVVAAMTLGIVVDDTVHFLSKYLRARREQGLSAADAVRYSFRTVGVALWITSLALIAGFLVLATSSFELNAGMGVLTSIVIAFALVADFLLLPPLLIRFDGWLNPVKGDSA